MEPGGRRGRNPFFIRSVFVRIDAGCPLEWSRNPFFIRSVFVRRGATCSFCMGCRNPFFIRSVFVQGRRYLDAENRCVAIPFSSGLCSFYYGCTKLTKFEVAIPFSSGLCSFLCLFPNAPGGGSRNPFFIRSVFVHVAVIKGRGADGSQSLFHQVCVRSTIRSIPPEVLSRNPFFIRSVFVLYERLNNLRMEAVAIPFSSGLCSFTAGKVRCFFETSQSLFHQVCVRSLSFQSIPVGPSRRNPFFIRSVFVHPSIRITATSSTSSQSLFHQVCVRSGPA